MKSTHRCKDAGFSEGCLIEADPEYTMDYSDVDPTDPYIYWCSHCGPIQHEIEKVLMDKMRGPGGDEFAEKFKQAIKKVKPDH